MKKSYDSHLKLVYCLGMEKTLLSDKIRKSIPRSTASTWRKLNMDKILDNEYDENTREKIQEFTEQENKISIREKHLLILMVRLRNIFIESLGEKKYYKMLRECKSSFIPVISRASEYINKSILLKFLNIKPQTYFRWKTEVKYFCTYSPIHLCARTHPLF